MNKCKYEGTNLYEEYQEYQTLNQIIISLFRSVYQPYELDIDRIAWHLMGGLPE